MTSLSNSIITLFPKLNFLFDLKRNCSFLSFLSQCSQTVRFHGFTSTSLNLTCGVPQGTKLGPIIFLAMVNGAAITLDKRWKYVDDLSLVEIVTKREPLGMQSHINALVDWCSLNDMKPNPRKCKTMQISFLHNPPLLLQINNQ